MFKIRNKILQCVAMLGFLLLGFQARAAEVPHLINFQSVLTDPAGNPLRDGMYDVTFRLQDEKGGEIYSETQSLELISGVASAMVGARGDLNSQVLSPDLPLFLSVQVAGNGPAQVMEVVSAPYSIYAEKALTVAPLSIGTESIAPKAITRDLLSEDLLTSLTKDWTKDIEANHTHVDGKISNLDTRLTTEETNRVAAVGQEKLERIASDTQLTSNLAKEITDRQAGDAQESSARQSGDTQLAVSLAAEATTRSNADANLQSQINDRATTAYVDQKVAAIPPPIVNESTPIGPQMVAAGVVAINVGTPTLGFNYKISGVTFTSNNEGLHVTFENQIGTPYMVQITPQLTADPNLGLNIRAPSVRNLATDSFDIIGIWSSTAGFHFAVWK